MERSAEAEKKKDDTLKVTDLDFALGLNAIIYLAVIIDLNATIYLNTIQGPLSPPSLPDHDKQGCLNRQRVNDCHH